MHRPVFKSLIACALLLVLFTINAAAQQKTYNKEWQKVDQLVTKELPKSALIEVKKIYDLAKKDKQDQQAIKALVYISGLQANTREDNDKLSIAEMEKE